MAAKKPAPEPTVDARASVEPADAAAKPKAKRKPKPVVSRVSRTRASGRGGRGR